MSNLPPALVTGLDRLGVTGADVHPLTPDASDRRYYRVTAADAAPFVIAIYSAPFAAGTLPFTVVAAHLAAMPLPVPRVRTEMPDLGIVVLDDLGDTTLQMAVDSAPDGRHRAWYERAVEHLVVLQQRGAALADDRLVPYTLAFDVEKLMWEMDFFITHFIEGFRGVSIAPAARDALRAELTTLSQELAGEPRVLCHRDYHSRNLMVAGDELFIIDFQDARLGPNTYDLVSLLRDCYVDMEPALFDALLARFRAAAAPDEDAGRFLERFDAMSVQRHLKALGTFGYQAVARSNPLYAQYVPRTTAYVRATFARRPRFSRLRDLLSPLVPEVA